MSTVNQRANLSICSTRGVVSTSTVPNRPLIRPISVWAPVATTTPRPVPAAINVPLNAIEVRSPKEASFVTGAVAFSTAIDSPVNIASCTRRPLAASNRRSAGTLSPASSRTTSPGTNSAASMLIREPPRNTEACGASIDRIADIASSARPS